MPNTFSAAPQASAMNAELAAAGVVIPPIDSLAWDSWDALKAGAQEKLSGRPLLLFAFNRVVVPLVEAELEALVGPRPATV